MPVASLSGLDIAYELEGNPDHPTMMLVHGLGAPLSAWPQAFVDSILEQGFQVLRIDNRDIGGSSKFDDLGVPNLMALFLKRKCFLPASAPYSLDDMAADAIGLLDHLKLDKVHVVGASMGGMIAQILSIQFPERILSLCSVMSTTGRRRVPGPSKEVSNFLASSPASRSPEDVIAHGMQMWRLIGSPDFPTPEAELRDYVIGNLTRGMTAAGVARQTAAIMVAPSRFKALGKSKIPTLIIHGDADPLVNVEGGRDTAKAMPTARYVEIAGMGHDLPAQLQEQIRELITQHAQAN